MKVTDVITPIGRMFGRDTIFLESIEIDYRGPRRLILRGEIVGTHVIPPVAGDHDLRFELCFDNVLGLQMVELDFAVPRGTFVEVNGSKWLASMRRADSAAKVKPAHRHYRVMTYDDVFDVVCTGYVLTVKRPRASAKRKTIRREVRKSGW